MITIRQGEGYVFEQIVTDDTGALADLTGAEAWLSLREIGTNTIKVKRCTVTLLTSLVKGVLLGDETATAGQYIVEMKAWLNDLPLVLFQDRVNIVASEMPVMPTVETL